MTSEKLPPLMCSQGDVPYNKAHLDAARKATAEAIREGLKAVAIWRSRAEIAEAEITRLQEALAAAETRKKALERRVYLDLDGVMADFDAHFPATFGLDHRSMADDDMWLTINGHASYFRDMPPCGGAIEFFRSIEHLDPIILTACPKSNYAHVAGQKREWVREHLSATATILPVMGGRHKPLFMHAAGDILIDDFEKNTLAWEAAGGTAILHRDFSTTAAAIRSLSAEEAQP